MVEQLFEASSEDTGRVKRWSWIIVLSALGLAIGIITVLTEVGLYSANAIEIVDESEGKWRTGFQQSMAHLGQYGATGEDDAWEAYRNTVADVRAIGSVRAEFQKEAPEGHRIESTLAEAGLIAPRARALGFIVPWMKRFGYLSESLDLWSAQDSLLHVAERQTVRLRDHMITGGTPLDSRVRDILQRLAVIDQEMNDAETRFENSVTLDQDQIQDHARIGLLGIAFILFFGGGFAFFVAFTGMRRAREEVREGKDLLHDLMESAAEAIFVRQIGGQFVSANEYACSMTGYTREELFTVDPALILTSRSISKRPLVGTELGEGEILRLEREIARKDGSMFPALASIRRIDERHILAIVRDISNLKQVEEDLRLFRKLIDHAGDPIQVIDPDTGRFLDMNDKSYESLGYTKEEMLQMNVFDIDPTVEPSFFPLHPEQISANETLFYEGRHRRKDGSEFPVEVRLNYVFLDNDYLVASVRDITTHKATEDTLRESKEEAEAASRLKSTILRNMGHELRTPLSSIIGYAQVLVEEGECPQVEALQMIEMSAKRLFDTFNSLLDLSTIESGAMNLHYEHCDLAEETAVAVRALDPIASSKNLNLIHHLPDEGVVAWMDVQCWTRIINNLVGNAIKFTDEGRIDVELDVHDDDVVLSVTDTGIGISEEFLPHVFEAFQQESADIDREFEGNGLGLAIVSELVEMLDGWVNVRSRKGEGSTFRVCIPVDPDEDEGEDESDVESSDWFEIADSQERGSGASTE